MQSHARIITLAGIILVAASFRLIPHWPNFTPIAAMALFGGAYLNRRWLAYLMPIAAMFLADLILGFHSTMPVVYAAFMLTVVIGRMLRGHDRPGNVIAASLSASTLFFLMTNFAAWMGNPFYSQSFVGLMTSYVAGLPFYLNGIAGDLFYSGVLFGSYYYVRARLPLFREI